MLRATKSSYSILLQQYTATSQNFNNLVKSARKIDWNALPHEIVQASSVKNTKTATTGTLRYSVRAVSKWQLLIIRNSKS